MAAVARRDPVLIAARALKTLRRANYMAMANDQLELVSDLSDVIRELDRIVGDKAVVRVTASPFGRDCA